MEQMLAAASGVQSAPRPGSCHRPSIIVLVSKIGGDTPPGFLGVDFFSVSEFIKMLLGIFTELFSGQFISLSMFFYDAQFV